ncbi:MAG TPA: L,D-transpeptidase family protein [Chitinophagaceae bacterium]|nr:L,D-transpeptidase family protein [Chitinophagaceae bacterium]
MKGYSIIICILLASFSLYAQPPLEIRYPDYQFQQYQQSYERVKQASAKTENAIRKMFQSKGIQYPCSNILYRAFKSTNELELWARNSIQDTFVLIKNYQICALSGILGPKRWEGDKQVPEGFYFIEEFNPKSNYYLAMLLNYPNYSDLASCDKEHPGGDIYIHGKCMTVGCLPMTDEWIEEIYTTCVQARINGTLNIPVHIFPLRFTQKGIDFLGRAYKNEETKHRFWVNIKRAYDYFEATHKTLPVMYDEKGDYAF